MPDLPVERVKQRKGISPFLSRNWDVPLVVALVALSFWLDQYWHRHNLYPPSEDEPIHLINALKLGGGLIPDVHRLFDSHYPPLTYLVTNAFFAAFGVSMTTAYMSISALYAAFILSMAWLGRAMAGARGAVLFAVVAAGTPFVRLYGHRYFVDVSLTAMVAFAFAALIASKGYTRPLACTSLGLGIALGMLAKWTFILFYAPAAMVSLVPTFRNAVPADRGMAVLALTAVAVMVTAMCWRMAALTHGLHPSLAMPLVLSNCAWAALLTWAWKRRHQREGRDARWNACSGFVFSLSLGMLCMSWWYWRSLGGLPRAISVGYGEERGPFILQFVCYFWWMFRVIWAGPIWMTVGMVAGLRSEALRWPTAMAIAGICSALTAGAWLTRVDGRYMIPVVPLALFVAFAWSLERPRLWPYLISLVSIVCFLQAAWWLPMMQPLAGCVTAVSEPPRFAEVSQCFRDSQFSAVPGVSAPVMRGNPYPEIVRILRDNHITQLRLSHNVVFTLVRNVVQAYADYARVPLQVMFPTEGPPPDNSREMAVLALHFHRVDYSHRRQRMRHAGHWEMVTVGQTDGRLPPCLDLFLPRTAGNP